MDKRDKILLMLNVVIFSIGVLFISLAIKQEYYCLKAFDFVVGIFDIALPISITSNIVRSMTR